MTTDDSPIGRTVSHFRLRSRLGAGGMGVVYEAEDLQLGRRVALKFLPADLAKDDVALRRFQREARAASALNHPNICTIHAIDQHEAEHFIVMELLEGRTLASRIASGPVTVGELLEIGLPIVDALESAHALGIVHRDLKPANIFLTARGGVKVLDFGLAKVADARPGGAETTVASDDLTGAGTTLGTAAYMSPEQARGEVADARSDIFSLGTVLYEMATGVAPFRAETIALTFERLFNRQPLPPSTLVASVPPDLDRILAHALEKDRQYRCQSATDLKAALLRLRRDLDARRGGDEPSGVGLRERTAEPASIAVLYFDNLSGAKEDEYLRDGITEDIITELSRIRRLKPRSRASVLPFRDRPATTPAEVGSALRVSSVLTGTVRRIGTRLRITAQLIDSHTDNPLWSDRYDRELRDVLDVQAEIAGNIADAMRITLSPEERVALAARPTEHPQAYDAFLRGRSHARRLSRLDLEFAMQMFESAVALDPAFGLAHAAIASTAAQYFYFCDRSPRWIDRARDATAVALRSAPDAPEVLVAQAWLDQAEGRFAQGEQRVREALRRNPDTESGYYLLARVLFAAGKYREVVAISEEALAHSVEDYNTWVPILNAHRALGLEEAAQDIVRREMVVFIRQIERVPEDARARVLLAHDYASLGRTEDARRELGLALTLRPGDGVVLYNAACVLCQLGLKDEALDTLRNALATGFHPHTSWARVDPSLALLHGDPQFDELFPPDASV